MKFRNLRISFAASLLAICTTCGMSIQAQQAATQPPGQTDTTIPPQALLQPAELMQMLHSPAKPLVLQTGSHVLYAEAHIPGSEYAGPAGTSAGLEALRERVTGLDKDSSDRHLLWLLPLGPLPEYPARLPTVAGARLYKCKGSLHR